MNPVFHQAAENTELGWLLAVMTVFFFAFFVLWTLWVFRPANRAHMDACAQMALDDTPPAPGGGA
jgi:cbb3-type cytochrome oxidase subunit 3